MSSLKQHLDFNGLVPYQITYHFPLSFPYYDFGSVLRFWMCNKANCKMDWTTEQDGNRENKGKEFVIFVYLVGTYVVIPRMTRMSPAEIIRRLWQD